MPCLIINQNFSVFQTIFQLVQIDVTFNVINGAWGVTFNPIAEGADIAFIILLILAVIVFLMRSGIISSVTWKSAEKGRANPIWAVEATFRQTSKFVLSAIIMIIIFKYLYHVRVLDLLLIRTGDINYIYSKLKSLLR